MNQKLSDWASIAEIVSGVAIVVTLIVLVAEVRTNGRLLERQIEFDRIERLGSIADADHLPEVLAKIKEVDSAFIRGATKAYMERYDLSFVEADRWARYQRVTWQSHESDYLAGQIGQLDNLIAIQLTFPDQALYWKAEQGSFEQSFVDYVNQLVPDYESILDDR